MCSELRAGVWGAGRHPNRATVKVTPCGRAVLTGNGCAGLPPVDDLWQESGAAIMSSICY